MSKLYSGFSLENNVSKVVQEKEPIDSFEFEDTVDFNDASEATQMAVEQLQCLQGMYSHMQDQKLCSEGYVVSLQGYSPLVTAMGRKLGLKNLPSLEDFSNAYSAKASHEYAMEGFKDMISKAWEKIKEFFRSFFNKISLFIKRIIKADLDLESYEKYCETLISKLVKNNATLDDNSPMPSTLPGLLASSGDDKIDSEFILTRGEQKVGNMLLMLEHITLKSTGGGLEKDLTVFNGQLKAFIEINKETPETQEELDKSISALRGRGIELMSRIFTHTQTDMKNMPVKAYESILRHYDSKDIKDDGFTLLGLVDPNDPYRQMPNGLNMFLSHVHSSNLFVCSDKDDLPNVSKTVEPIGKVENLSKYYNTYKNTLARVNIKGLDSKTVSVGKEVDKILSLLQKDYDALMTKNKNGLKSYSPEFMVEMFSKVNKVKGEKAINEINDTAAAIENALELKGTPIDFNLSDLLEVLHHSYNLSNGSKGELEYAVNSLKKEFVDKQKFLTVFIDDFLIANNDLIKIDISPEETLNRLNKLKDLNTYLVNLFNRLQTLYKNIISDFYGAIVTLRYAMIKYIYDSAKRYSY